MKSKDPRMAMKNLKEKKRKSKEYTTLISRHIMKTNQSIHENTGINKVGKCNRIEIPKKKIYIYIYK